WIVQSNLYVRKFQQAHVDGNGAEVERCSGMLGNALFNTLCLENDGFPTQPQANFQILNANNRPINCPPGSGNTCATTPWGTVDRTWTNALTTGGTLQATNDDKVFGHGQLFHHRWQHRSQHDRLPSKQRAWLRLPRPVRRTKCRRAGDWTDYPHRRESRLQSGQSRCPEYVLRPLRQ